MLKTKDILPKLNEVSSKLFNCNIGELTEKQLYTVMCTLLKELLAQKRKKFKDEISPKNKKIRPHPHAGNDFQPFYSVIRSH